MDSAFETYLLSLMLNCFLLTKVSVPCTYQKNARICSYTTCSKVQLLSLLQSKHCSIVLLFRNLCLLFLIICERWILSESTGFIRITKPFSVSRKNIHGGMFRGGGFRCKAPKTSYFQRCCHPMTPYFCWLSLLSLKDPTIFGEMWAL